MALVTFFHSALQLLLDFLCTKLYTSRLLCHATCLTLYIFAGIMQSSECMYFSCRELCNNYRFEHETTGSAWALQPHTTNQHWLDLNMISYLCYWPHTHLALPCMDNSKMHGFMHTKFKGAGYVIRSIVPTQALAPIANTLYPLKSCS